MTKDDFLYGLKACGCMYHQDKKYYEHNELVKCFEDFGVFKTMTPAGNTKTVNNLCNSCTNIGCEFQSGIVRTKCAFYMPPHIESDNCGNYVVMQPTSGNET